MPTATTATAGVKFYCEMHGPNRTHNTKDYFELKQRAKCAKADANRGVVDKVSYKDLNAFVNAKVSAALSEAKKNQKKKEAKKVDDSSDEESNHKLNVLAAASDDDSDSNTSCVPSKGSDSNNK
eukprot:7550731-Ditylum_brightwellii.AAC.1